MFVFLYKIFTIERPSYLLPLFPKPKADIRRSNRTLAVAASSAFDLPTPSTTTFENSFSYQAMKLWDTLSCRVRLNPSINSFKSALFEYLLNMKANLGDD